MGVSTRLEKLHASIGASFVRSPIAAAWFGAALLLGLYRGLDRVFVSGIAVAPGVYAGPSIMAGALGEPTVWWALLAMCAIPLIGARRIGWAELGPPQLRWLFGGILVALAWAFSTYDHNHYLGHWHILDRVLVVVATGLAIRHPAFVGVALVAITIVAQQFDLPLGSYTWTDKRVLFRLLALLTVYNTLAVVWRSDWRSLLTVVFTFHAVDYLAPAWGKLQIEWLEKDRLDYLWVAFHTNGWLDQLSDQTALAVAGLIRRLNTPLILGTIVIEIAPLVLLANRRVAIAILASCILLHAGIFASSGIFFWKWMLLGGLLIAVSLTPPLRDGFFGLRSRYFWLSLALMYPCYWVTHPVNLAWLDTPLNNMYELDVEGESGRIYRVGRNQMSPYDVVFAQNRFAYLVDEPVIAMTAGTTKNIGVHDRLVQLDTPSAVREMQQERGRKRLSERRRLNFARFVCRYYQDVERRGGKLKVPAALAAPKHIWSWRSTNVFDWKEPVRSVRIRWVSTWYDGAKVITLSDKEVARIVLKGAPTTSTASPSTWMHVCEP